MTKQRETTGSKLAVFGEFAPDGRSAYDNAVTRFRDNKILLPTFAQLSDPATIPASIQHALSSVDKDAADPLNLFRVHWFNARADSPGQNFPTFVDVPTHIELPSELTGVDARIVLAFGNRFPMIRAHKVLAAYSCLAARLVTGRFDPINHRAIWPSTGNYARGGIAISKIMGCRGVAILPEGMSRERFEWLERWTTNPAEDVIKTYGTESNVKEIYDACNALALDPANVILNQFSEFSNHLGHYAGHWASARTSLYPCDQRPAREAGGFRFRIRLGRNARRRRLPQGPPWCANRGGRGARVSDDALQRLR